MITQVMGLHLVHIHYIYLILVMRIIIVMLKYVEIITILIIINKIMSKLINGSRVKQMDVK